MTVAAIAPLSLSMPESAAALAPSSAAATQMPIASGGGGGGAGYGPAEAGSIGLDVAQKGATLWQTIDGIITGHKQFKENKRQFNTSFNENVRQFGLQYALQDFATRQGISLQKAQQLFQAEQLGLQKQATGENIKTSAQGRGIQATQFQWAKEDRAKQQNFIKALQKGVATGLLGGK
jgi:hypothetical protein